MPYQILQLLPETILSFVTVLFVCISPFVRSPAKDKIILALFVCTTPALYYLFYPATGSLQAFGGIMNNDFTKIVKIAIFISSLLSVIIYYNYCGMQEQSPKTELAGFILFSAAAGMVAVSAQKFLLLLCSLELQAICAYVLAGFNKYKKETTIAGVKYFTLGSIMSCLGLFGISFIYGFGGSTDFDMIFSTILTAQNSGQTVNLGLKLGIILFISNILFKLAIPPFHTWISDIYRAAPVVVLSFFSAGQVIASLVVLINLIKMIPPGAFAGFMDNIFTALSAGAMLIGAAGGLTQKSLKRLMAYSFILNVGYALMATSSHDFDSAVFYILVYGISSILFFASIVALLAGNAEDVDFDSIAATGKNRKAIAAVITISCLSMIGIPPFAGFFGKYYVFTSGIAAGKYWLVMIAALSTIISAAYYLRIIKYIYFVEVQEVKIYIGSKKGLVFISIMIAIILMFISLMPFAEFYQYLSR